MSIPPLDELRQGDKRLLARALAAVETDAGTDAVALLLDRACAEARAHVLGITGPPGVGKSTLTSRLIARVRAGGETVGIIAVDPSSRRTGGALLGDRARMGTDPADQGVFVRSMAARDRLGGLSDQTIAAMVLMRAIYDRVIVETVGIGQSEADIAFVADTLLLCVQPSSGDSLQFMKAGVMELPDIVAVTKADIGDAARRARADVESSLGLTPHAPRRPVVLVSATEPAGLDEIEAALEHHREWLAQDDRLRRRRETQQQAWVEQAIRARFGTAGLEAARPLGQAGHGPFTAEAAVARELAARLGI
jgi:LAO/AO transport system kinase